MALIVVPNLFMKKKIDKFISLSYLFNPLSSCPLFCLWVDTRVTVTWSSIGAHQWFWTNLKFSCNTSTVQYIGTYIQYLDANGDTLSSCCTVHTQYSVCWIQYIFPISLPMEFSIPSDFNISPENPRCLILSVQVGLNCLNWRGLGTHDSFI